MKVIHQKLLNLAQTHDLGSLTYRQIGSMLGGEHPYQVQYNIEQLLKDGLLLKNKRSGAIYLSGDRQGTDNLINIPILGSVSCGVAVDIANNEQGGGFISVSPSLITIKSPEKLFALKASGQSMNTASIMGNAVDDGDYVIVRQSDWGEANNGDHVVSLIGDCANLKRLSIDTVHNRIILLSESNDDYPPIIIAAEDMAYYRILGVAIGVVKALPL